MSDVIGVHDQLRAALVARWSAQPEGKGLRRVRNSEYWRKPLGTLISAHRSQPDPRTPEQHAHDLEVARRVMQSGRADLIRRWLHGENVERELPEMTSPPVA